MSSSAGGPVSVASSSSPEAASVDERRRRIREARERRRRLQPAAEAGTGTAGTGATEAGSVLALSDSEDSVPAQGHSQGESLASIPPPWPQQQQQPHSNLPLSDNNNDDVVLVASDDEDEEVVFVGSSRPIVRQQQQPRLSRPESPPSSNFASILNEPEGPARVKCAICMSTPDADVELVSTICGHIFCRPCLNDAFKHSGKKLCPTCRKSQTAKGAIRTLISFFFAFLHGLLGGDPQLGVRVHLQSSSEADATPPPQQHERPPRLLSYARGSLHSQAHRKQHRQHGPHLLTRWFGQGTPRPVGLAAYACFGFRDSLTMAAAFTFPPLLSEALQGRGVAKGVGGCDNAAGAASFV
ncbi:hypothetical protein BC830DRAFT_1169802 [Chytriomyces sp. MP71]|nr:hypothetical protein BC830DRAFT_1169802 [Chytriomyces sp. MP71]